MRIAQRERPTPGAVGRQRLQPNRVGGRAAGIRQRQIVQGERRRASAVQRRLDTHARAGHRLDLLHHAHGLRGRQSSVSRENIRHPRLTHAGLSDHQDCVRPCPSIAIAHTVFEALLHRRQIQLICHRIGAGRRQPFHALHGPASVRPLKMNFGAQPMPFRRHHFKAQRRAGQAHHIAGLNLQGAGLQRIKFAVRRERPHQQQPALLRPDSEKRTQHQQRGGRHQQEGLDRPHGKLASRRHASQFALGVPRQQRDQLTGSPLRIRAAAGRQFQRRADPLLHVGMARFQHAGHARQRQRTGQGHHQHRPARCDGQG